MIINRKPIILGGKLPTQFKEWLNQEFGKVHTIMMDDKPWFMATEIAKILGYADPNKSVNQMVKPQHRKSVDITNQINNLSVNKQFRPINPNRVFIDLPGLMKLIGHSHMTKAEKFAEWVYGEVLLSIYKHGAYMTPETLKHVDNLQGMQKLMDTLKQENEQLKPLAFYTQEVLKSDEALTFTIVAKEFGMTANALHKLLNKLKVIYTRNKKQAKVWQPHKKYDNLGLFTFQTYPYEDRSGRHHSSTTLYITQLGRLEIHKILAQLGIHPIGA